MIAEIIINSNARALNRIFDYNVPSQMEGAICVGDRVLVPFGNKKALEEGYVIGFKDNSEFKVKDIEKIQDGVKLTEFNIELAKLMARRYFCNISDCIKLMLPPGTSSKEEEKRISDKTGNFIYLGKTKDEIDFDIQTGKIKSEKHIRTLEFLKNNEGIYITDLERFVEITKSVINTLKNKGYIQIVEEKIERNPFKNKKIEQDEKKVLNQEQEKCFIEISKSIDENKFSNNLIFGVTGSR